MRPLIAAFALGLLSCAEEQPPASAPRDKVALSTLPAEFQHLVGVQTAMARGGLFDRPRQCDDFTLSGGQEKQDWGAIGRALDSALGQRAGTVTTVSAYDESALTIAIRSDSIGVDTAVELDWTLRRPDAGASGESETSLCVSRLALRVSSS